MKAGARQGQSIRVGSRRVRPMIAAAAIAGAALLLVALANAHLVYVAFSSQPDCVAHVKGGERAGAGAFRAAKSSC